MFGPSWHLGLGLALLLGQLAFEAEGCCERQEPPPEPRCCNLKENLQEAHQQQRCHNEEPSPSEEREEADDWDSHLEFMDQVRRRQLEEAAAYEANVIPDYYKRMAVSHYNDHSPGPYYRHLEDTQLKVKKAIGTMAYVRLLLEKTNCFKDDQRDRFVTFTNEYLDSLGCGLPLEMEQTKMECTFGIFMDARSGHEAVVSHKCAAL
ncbi:uncharacterized protein LOC121916052 [Sceloporus undulatus]|uniref:uncharacterized protein LOC121916052 n=1 Tax=Sceloporus undulatus TaxID=8520 RepID=UPI001C4B6B3B|nr:uncharacterized protein LOC121916052 [Sceloporus undulatus]